jgi:hypothetical protein
MHQRRVSKSGRSRRASRSAFVLLFALSAFACTSVATSPSATRSSPAASPSLSLASAATTAVTGLRWSAPFTFQDATSIDAVVDWKGKLIAAGRVPSATNQDAAIWESSDAGATWTRLDTGATTFADSGVSGIVKTPSGLLAWGRAGEPVCTGQGAGTTCGPFPVMLWTSADGAAWKRITDLATFKGATIADMALSPQGLVAVGDTGWTEPAIWASSTGAAWQRLSLSSATFKDAHFWSIRVSASGYFLAGGVGNTEPVSGGAAAPDTGAAAAWWSLDGRAWTKGTVNRADGIGSSLGSIYVGSGGFVAVGSASGSKTTTAWSSVDGRAWQPIFNRQLYADVPTPAPGAPSIPSFTMADDGSHMLALDDLTSLNVWTSSDGLTWQPMPFSGAIDSIPSPGQWIQGLFSVPDGLIVVGQGGSSSPIELWHATVSS